MGQSEQALLMELHSGLAVVRSEQTGINRRLGDIEKGLKDAAEGHLQELQNAQEARWNWMAEVIRTVSVAVVLTAASWAVRKVFNVELLF